MTAPEDAPGGQQRVPLRDVAQSAPAFTEYLQSIERVLLDTRPNLEALYQESRLHCRHVRVEGDRWYDPARRSLPVERALKDVLKQVDDLVRGLEKSTHKRHAHDDKVKAVTQIRRRKVLTKERKRLSAPTAPAVLQEKNGEPSTVREPTSIYDLGRRDSA